MGSRSEPGVGTASTPQPDPPTSQRPASRGPLSPTPPSLATTTVGAGSSCDDRRSAPSLATTSHRPPRLARTSHRTAPPREDLSAQPPRPARTSQPNRPASRGPLSPTAPPREDLSARPRPTSQQPRSAHVPHATTGAASLIGERASSSWAERRASAAPTRRCSALRACAPPVSPCSPRVRGRPRTQRHFSPTCFARRRKLRRCACSGCQSAALRVRGGDKPVRSCATDSIAPPPNLSARPRPASPRPPSSPRPTSPRPPSSPPPSLATTSKLAPAQPRDDLGRRMFLMRRPAQRAL